MAHRTQTSASPSQLWDLIIKIGFLVAFCILVACLAIPLRPRFADYRELTEVGHALEIERAGLQREIERREAELQMLERDPLYVEIKARDVLDMCQPGEVVFRFENGGNE